MIEDSYDEKVEYLHKYIGLNGTHLAGEEMLKIISLVNLLVTANRKKSPEVTPLEILQKVYKNQNDLNLPGVSFILERLSLMCELFLTEKSKFSNYGLTSKEAILEEINKQIDEWIPF